MNPFNRFGQNFFTKEKYRNVDCSKKFRKLWARQQKVHTACCAKFLIGPIGHLRLQKVFRTKNEHGINRFWIRWCAVYAKNSLKRKILPNLPRYLTKTNFSRFILVSLYLKLKSYLIHSPKKISREVKTLKFWSKSWKYDTMACKSFLQRKDRS